MKYGNPPVICGHADTECDEMLHYQCLPIQFPDEKGFKLPERLAWAKPILDPIPPYPDHYIYLTARNSYISPGYSGSRPGWHSDGFLTDDLSYIWSDCLPTEFAIQDFEIDENCEDSLRQFAEQVERKRVHTFVNKVLLCLDASVIHQPAENTDISGLRTFVKFTVSKDRFNLKGNSHNYLFNYTWDMEDRGEVRNHQKGTY